MAVEMTSLNVTRFFFIFDENIGTTISKKCVPQLQASIAFHPKIIYTSTLVEVSGYTEAQRWRYGDHIMFQL